MKKIKFFSGVAIFTAFCLLGVACHKESKQPTVIKTSTLERLQEYDKTYLSKNRNTQRTTAAPPSWKKTVASDVAGGIGGALFGPIGSFCGALTASLLYAFYTPIFNPTTNTSTYSGNPYDIYGQMHNASLLYVVNNTNYTNNGFVDTTSVITSGKQYGLLNYTPPLSSMADTVSNGTIIALDNLILTTAGNQQSQPTDIFDALENANYITPQEDSIISEYLNTFFDAQNSIQYSEGAEDIIVQSQDLSDNSKFAILAAMSIARNSSALWPQQ